MGFGSVTHWVILLVIVVLIFGTKKLKNIGSDLGSAVKGFKDGVKGGVDSKPTDASSAPAEQVTSSKSADSNTVDVEAKTKS